MAYYQGDNYSGSYYQGAFPFIGAALALGKKLVPKIVGAGAKLLGKTRAVTRAAPIGTLTTVGSGAYAYGKARGRKEQAMRELMGGRRGRRINVTNVKALRRAGRRVRGFLKLASRLGALPVSRGKGKLFKRRRRA